MYHGYSIKEEGVGARWEDSEVTDHKMKDTGTHV